MSTTGFGRTTLDRGRMLLAALLLVLFASFVTVPYVWLLFFAAVLFAVLLDALTTYTRRLTGWSRGWSYTAVLLVLAGLFALLVAFAVPQLRDQVQRLVEQLPQAWSQLRSQVEEWGWGDAMRRVLPRLQESWKQASLASTSAGVLSTTFGVLADLVVFLFVGIYLAVDPGLYARGVALLVPRTHRPRALEWLDVLGTTLRRWLFGRFLLMTVNAVLTAGGLMLLGVPLPILLGLVSGALNFIPNFGPILAAVPAVLLGFTVDTWTALYVAAFYFAYQMFDGYVLTPLVQQRTVWLPPALTIMSQVLLGVLFGPWGVLLAVPLTAVAVVSIKMLYVEDVLDEDVRLPGEPETSE